MFFIFAGSLFCGLFLIFRLGGRILFSSNLRSQRASRRPKQILLGTFVLCIVGFLLALTKLASADVRSDFDEVLFYTAAFSVLLLLVLVAFEYLGVSLRDDVAERGNSAAATTICGLLVGETFCLAGANSGNGPGPEVVFMCAVLTTSGLFLLWIAFDVFGGAVDAITINRNLAAGLRAAGLLGGSGAILGSSVAGDWVSLNGTLRDFVRYSWPIFVVLLVATLFEKCLSRRPLKRKVEVNLSIVYCCILFSSSVVYAVRVWNRQ